VLNFLPQRFLNDYGLIWVGETRDQLEDTESVQDEEELPARSLCKLGKAPIDFDLILENIKDLNSLVGEGISQIEHTPRGARLRRPEPLPVILYQNGIVVGHGAFRPYQHPGTQQCLQDILDGYFPSELQPRYPDGVPLQVTDRRDVVFQNLPGSFPGLGHVVGTSESKQVQETSEIPGKILNLPQKSCWGQFQMAEGPPCSPLFPLLLQALDELSAAGMLQPPSSPLQLCRLLRAWLPALWAGSLFLCSCITTAGTVRASQGGNSDSYEIISTFPQRVYTDNSRSLQECGLVPSASLLLRRRDPSQKTA
uniref:UBX domain-containing protein 11 n=1 Tax=Catharus ustulatus TaxID=91951 RepID=A0A8C3U2R2_CATUS